MAGSMIGHQAEKLDAPIEKAVSFNGKSNGTPQLERPPPPPSGSPPSAPLTEVGHPQSLTQRISDSFHGVTPVQPPPAPSNPTSLPPPLTQRSQTMPTLIPNARLPAKDKEKDKPALTIDPPQTANTDMDDSKSSICLSPSWDQGKKAKKERKQLDKERRKQEGARKEADKKARKEAEKQRAVANKAGKREGRLNKKPPPAAMDTQRMPSELRPQPGSRRNSILSILSSNQSSADSSRRSSRDLKRLSINSNGSSKDQRRSQSTPASSTEIEDPSDAWRPVVSGVAPQLPALPRFGLHSRDGSSGGSKANSWGSEEAYSREMVKYANQLSASPQRANFAGDATTTLQPARPLIRSHTDTALMTINQEQPIIKEVPRALAERKGSDDSSRTRSSGARHNPQGPDTHAMRSLHRVSGAARNRSAIEDAQQNHIHPLQANPIQIISSLDGGSYVHRERMRKQQQSLRGFNDEQAVRAATRLLGEEEKEISPLEPITTLPERQEIMISSQEAEEVPPVPPIPTVQASEPSNAPAEQYPNQSKRSQDDRHAVMLNNPDGMPAKRHTFLGMGFRSKPFKQPRNSVMAESMSRGSEENKSAKPPYSPRLDTSNLTEYPRLENGFSKESPPSKAERILGQAPPQSPPPQPPASRSRLSQAVVDKERSPSGKASSPIQGRTKLANAIVDKESPPRKKEASSVQARSNVSHDAIVEEPQTQVAPLVQTHSRTRTSSSQLLNDYESLPRSLPRSTTAPVLPTFNPEPFGINHGESTSASPPKDKQNQQIRDVGSSNQAKFRNEAAEEAVSRPQQSAQATVQKSESKPVPELVIEGVTPEGIVRKTSLKRPRSNPQLQVTTPDPPMPSLDFLPQLKHQALVKPKPRSNLRNSVIPNDETARPSSSQFPVPAAPMHNALPSASNSTPNLTAAPRSPKRLSSQMASHSYNGDTLTYQRALGSPNRASFGGRPRGLEKTVAKIIVTCCSCTRWIDLPSDLFEAMAMPARLTKLDGSAAGQGEARLDTAVQCPWCAHCMTSDCCSTDTWVCNKYDVRQQQIGS